MWFTKIPKKIEFLLFPNYIPQVQLDKFLNIRLYIIWVIAIYLWFRRQKCLLDICQNFFNVAPLFIWILIEVVHYLQKEMESEVEKELPFPTYPFDWARVSDAARTICTIYGKNAIGANTASKWFSHFKDVYLV